MSDIFFCLSFGARLPGVESGIVAENGTYFALRVIFTGQNVHIYGIFLILNAAPVFYFN